jgi:hypothetical protein
MQNMEPKCRASSSSNSNSAGTSTLANLPKEVLVLVMRKLSPRQRFGGCALTCRALLAAAVAATQELQLSNISQQRADSIALWLAKHSRTALLKLDLEGIRPGNGRMPVNLAVPFQILAHLQSLRLQSLAVQAQSGIGGSVGSLRQLAMLSSLQRLQLSHLQPFISSTKVMSPSPVCAVTIAANSAGLGAALCQLVQLTALVLTAGHTWPLSGHVLAKASCLSRLQYLSLGYVGTAEHPVELQDLPDSLISVNLNTVHLGSIQTVSSSWQLSGLQRLTLNWTQAEPALLLRMPQLQTLYWFPSENLVLEKMPVLPMLVQLQYLRTIHLDCMASAADVADYAALTANSQLEELWLENLSLAAPAIAHIFPVGRRLPQLRTLQTAGLNVLWDEFEKRGLLLGPSSAGQIAACCPALQALGVLIVDTALAAADLQPLLQLSALTHLELGGEGCDDAVAEQLLAKLTGEHVQQLQVVHGVRS